MKRSVRVLLLTAMLAATCACRAAKPLPTPAEPSTLLHEGWQDLQPRTVCLQVQQSFQETAEDFSLPVEPLVRQILKGLGLGVVPAGQACDTDLLVELTGQPVAADYLCVLGSECGHCYTGAEIGGEVRLTRSDRAPLSLPLAGSKECPSSISHCPKKPEDAPFADVWPRAVLGALLDLWGSRALDVAFANTEESIRLAAVNLGYAAGLASLPMLINALSDKSASVRSLAAGCLRYLGEDAKEAVPALINLLKDQDPRVSSNAAVALHAISGQDFGADQAQWRRWLAEGSPTPAPWTSWEGVVMMPGARWANESGTMRAFTVAVSCDEAIEFYRAQSSSPAEATPRPFRPQTVTVGSGAGSVELYFYDATVSATQPRCSVQFWVDSPVPGPAPPVEAPK
jgi:hypothetical protein